MGFRRTGASRRPHRLGGAPSRALLSLASPGMAFGLLRSRARGGGSTPPGGRAASAVRELEGRVEELRASRTRLAEATLLDRCRLERALHDGAQQRLVALCLTLRLAQARLPEDPATAEELLGGAQAELREALEELRELARCIHPAVLSDRGLEAAIEALAGRCPLPVELAEVPSERLPAPIETAAYHVIAEAVRKATRHASATEIADRVARRDGWALVEVADDGRGGADLDRGSGLRRLADQVAAFDGRLTIEDLPDGGTRVRAQFPV